MPKKNKNAKEAKNSNLVAKKEAFRMREEQFMRPLVVKVGDVSVTGRNVKQCMEPTECAKRLGESTPNQIRIDGVSVYTGASNTTGAVESGKEFKATSFFNTLL